MMVDSGCFNEKIVQDSELENNCVDGCKYKSNLLKLYWTLGIVITYRLKFRYMGKSKAPEHAWELV